MSKLKIGDKVRIKSGSMIHDHGWVYDGEIPNYRGGKPNEMIPVYFKVSRRASTVTITHIDNLENTTALRQGQKLKPEDQNVTHIFWGHKDYYCKSTDVTNVEDV